MDREFIGVSALSTSEISALINCANALLRGTNIKIINAMDASEEDQQKFIEMLIHLKSGANKLKNMMDKESKNIKWETDQRPEDN